MRIAIDARYLNDSYSGIAKYSENLVTHLSKVDRDNEYVVFIHPTFNRRLRVGENFRVVRYPARPVSMRTLLSFGRRVHRMKCDFLHSLSPVSPILGIKRKILTIHDLQLFTIEEEQHGAARTFRSRIPSLFHRTTFPRFVRSATWLVAVSQATKDRLASFFPETEHKTVVVHSGVEEVFSAPPEATISQLVCKKLALPRQFVLYVGTAKPNKNLPAMLRAFARARREHPDPLGTFQFLLVLGPDRRSSECRRVVRDLDLKDHVQLLGPITEEEKRVLYARATILFSVTRAEGFGLPIVEAQASGLPVLAGDDASVPEVTAGSALLVDPDDEDLIAERLAQILMDEDLRADLSRAGKKNVERFSWQTTAQKVLEMYDLLM